MVRTLGELARKSGRRTEWPLARYPGMTEHPIREIHEMRRELWRGRRAFWLAVVICGALCVIALILFAAIDMTTLPGPALPVAATETAPDPVEAGAQDAFDVVPPVPDTVTRP